MRGKIWLDANGGCISIRYSPQRFAVLSKTPGARYDKGAKHWRVPVDQLALILKNPLFSKRAFEYAFSDQQFLTQLEHEQVDIGGARSRWHADPFSVSKSDIALIGCTIVIQEGGEGFLQGVFYGSSTERKRIAQLPYLIYVKRQKSFLFSAQYVHEFLKYLRDSEITFAVEQSLSTALKEFAPLRHKIIEGTHKPHGAELYQCKLTPALDAVNGNIICRGFIQELLALIKVPIKKRKGAVITAGEALSLLHSAAMHNIKVWTTNSYSKQIAELLPTLHHEFSGHSEDFHDCLLWIEKNDLAWTTRGSEAGLLVPSQSYAKFRKMLTGAPFKLNWTSVYFGERWFVSSPALDLPEFFQHMSTEYGPVISVAHSFRTVILTLQKQSELLKRQAQYHEMTDCQIENPDNPELLNKLYPHQRVAVKWMLENEFGLLGDDMGLGKTLSALTSFNELLRRELCEFALVICPNSLVHNWIREAKQWLPSLQLATLPQQKRDRENFLKTIGEGYFETIQGIVVNFETARLESVWPLLKQITEKKKVLLLIDESQRIKNAQSQSFQAIREVAELCNRRFLLSGTPSPKDISDMWGQMFILDRGERFGRNYLNWLRTVAELGTKWSEYAVKKFIPEAVKEAATRVHEVLLRRKKEDVISLPEKTFLFRDVELTGDQKTRYDQVREELLIKVQSKSGELSTKSITSLLEEYLRAVQMASNPRLVDPAWKGDPAKFLELDEIVGEVVEEQGEKLVIWTNYLKNVAELCERYKAHSAAPFSGEVSTTERAKTVEAFQKDPKKGPKILVAIPAAGGVGITLTAAQTAVYVDRTWNAEHWMQSIDRVHRIGQKGTVRIIVLNGCKVDELIGFNLRRKERQLQELMTISMSDLDQQLFPSREELVAALTGSSQKRQ